MARLVTEAERKLQKSHYDAEKKGRDWDKYVALHKEQHTIMESLVDHDYSGINHGTKVHHFLQEIKNIELEAAVHVAWA